MNETSCYIRFFYAATDTETLQVSVNDTLLLSELSYRTVTGYAEQKTGFLTITLAGTRSRRVYLQKTLPFFLPIKYTLAIIQTDNGLDIKQIFDYMCPLFPAGFGCIRAANLAYRSGPLDLFLYGNKLVFADVTFKEVTPFKPFQPGEYGFYLTPGQDEENPLLSILTDVEAGTMYTMCIINGTWGPDALDVVVLDYDESVPRIEPR